MSRHIHIASRINVVRTIALVPPADAPHACIFHWTLDGRKRAPYVRFTWHVPTGDLNAGVVQHHLVLMPRLDPLRPFQSHLRGFWWPSQRLLALRPFHWPQSLYERFNAALSRTVAERFLTLVKPLLPQARFELDIDNDWLRRKFPQYAPW